MSAKQTSLLSLTVVVIAIAVLVRVEDTHTVLNVQAVPPVKNTPRSAAPRETIPPVVLAPSPTTVQHIPTRTTTQRSSVSDWTWHPPGAVSAPVLLYHHVAERTPGSRYQVSPDIFERQIALLKEAGYTAIPVSLLAKAIREGADLPPRPVLITFDDGYMDVYENALPVLQRYDYIATAYVITAQLNIKGYMGQRELNRLLDSGWEIGSHTQTHSSLKSPGTNLDAEIVASRQDLEEMFGVLVSSFSYPYGLTSSAITQKVRDAGYLAAVGLGISMQHTNKSRYYLSRIEIRGDDNPDKFATMLAEAQRQTTPANALIEEPWITPAH